MPGLCAPHGLSVPVSARPNLVVLEYACACVGFGLVVFPPGDVQPTKGGTIGMTLDSGWAQPLTDSPGDMNASERSMLVWWSWWHGRRGSRILGCRAA